MRLSKYISVPQSSRTEQSAYFGQRGHSKDDYRYLSYFQILVSLLTAIIIINFRLINISTIFGNSQTKSNNQQSTKYSILDIMYPFGLTLLFKLVIVMNYCYRKKTLKVGHLQRMAKVPIFDLIIPGFLKSLYYVSMMIATMYFQSDVVFCSIVCSVVGVEILNWKLYNRKYLKILSNNSEKSFYHRSRYRLPFRDIITQIFLLLAIFQCNRCLQNENSINYYSFSGEASSLLNEITIIIILAILTISYLYFHSRIFQLYEIQIDELISKEYVVQISNICIIGSIYFLYTYLLTQQANQTQLSPSQTSSSGSQNKLIFFLEYPINSLAGYSCVIIYEYLCFEILKKENIKSLLLTQLSSVFWLNVYFTVKDVWQFNMDAYISIMASILGWVFLLRVFDFQRLRRISFYGRSKKKATKSKDYPKLCEQE